MTHSEATLLRSQIEYDKLTGVFRWFGRAGVRAGSIAGRLDSDGYRQIAFNGRRYPAARLAWLYVTGQWPAQEIDHRNLVRDDDRFDNLREATHGENACNRARQSNNTSGVKGVHWNKKLGKWQAAIKVGESRIHLGVFVSRNAAAVAYAVAALQHHGAFARTA